MNQEILQIWIERTQCGEQRAANRLAGHLLTKFRPAILSAARRIGEQEALSVAGLSVAEAICQIRPGHSIESLFICRFTSNVLTHARSHVRRVQREADAAQVSFESYDHLESEFAISARLKNAALSDRDREIIMARLRGETFSQISKSLSISVAAVGFALSRILKKLEVSNELA